MEELEVGKWYEYRATFSSQYFQVLEDVKDDNTYPKSYTIKKYFAKDEDGKIVSMIKKDYFSKTGDMLESVKNAFPKDIVKRLFT